MDITTVDYRQILSLNGEGITYVDDNGQKEFVSFVRCKDSWVNAARKNWLGDTESVNWGASRCVGECIGATNPMYYQFYGENGLLRITFDADRSWWRKLFAVPPATLLAFQRLEEQIKKAGWSIFHIV